MFFFCDPIRDPIRDPVRDPIRDPVRSGPILVLSTPATDRVEPKLALGNATERALEPAALQLTNFSPVCIFSQRGGSGWLLG